MTHLACVARERVGLEELLNFICLVMLLDQIVYKCLIQTYQ